MITVKNRALSFVIVGAIYVLASAVGILTYATLTLKPWLSLLIADVAATIFTFIFSLIFSNASVYDPYWSVQPIVICLCFAASFGVNLSAVIMMAAVMLWGIRLTANWAYTFHGLTHQDWRYTMLKEKTRGFYPIINFVGIHLVPTLVVYFVTVPVVYVVLLKPDFSPLMLIGCILSLFAVTLQGTADYQMHRYRKNRTSPFIRDGLWKYSRHPNYLGEILMWWGMGISAVALLGGGWHLLLGAVLNTVLFIFVSIPLADGRQKRKPGFEEYKRQTRALLPIYKKQNT